MVLLAFLSLAVTHHNELFRHLDFPSSFKASEEYYLAAKEELGDPLSDDSLPRIQTLLMLGMKEWSMLKFALAWRRVGTAINAAHQAALHADERKTKQQQGNPEVDAAPSTFKPMSEAEKADRFINAEIRRRTYWSCFIMDRYLSGGCGGEHRPSSIHVKEVRIQLPCSESAFNVGKVVKTSTLMDILEDSSAEPTPYARNGDIVHQETVLSPQCHYILALELFRGYMAWSLGGGRRYSRSSLLLVTTLH